jgi:UDP-N-acetylenolpyruvoylglucosamine reductase
MSSAIDQLLIERDAPIRTWFKVGGRADRFATPASDTELAACLELDPELVVLGDGANLLVADEGVDRLVVRLGEAFARRPSTNAPASSPPAPALISPSSSTPPSARD